MEKEELKKEQQDFMNALDAKMKGLVDEAVKGLIGKDELAAQVKSAVEEFGGKLGKDNEALVEQVKNLGETIEKLKKDGLSQQTINKFDEKLNEMFESEKFADFVAGRTRKSGEFTGFTLKDVVNLTGDYTGSILISQQQDKVVTSVAPKKVHMRDVITTLQGDPEYPQLAFAQIYDVDRNARFVTENGTLPASAFKVKEVQAATKRLGTHLFISKRMLKSRTYVRSFILNMLPEAVKMAEDWNILFGDGNGENLLGIVNHTGVQCVSDIISTAVVTGAAGAVDSIKTYNSGADTIVEFKNAQPDILDGMKITFANATDSSLNATFDVVKMNDRQILIKGLAYVAEATPGGITFTVKHGAYKSIEAPNSEDVVKTIFAVMSYAQYSTNAIVLNPITVNAIESEKDTTGRNLGLVTRQGGVKYIAGIPVVEYTGIPAGSYLVGDFNTAASLVDYTALTLEWAEDVDSKLKNQIALIAQEEVIFPVYMPWAFAYGKLADVKTAITMDATPAGGDSTSAASAASSASA